MEKASAKLVAKLWLRRKFAMGETDKVAAIRKDDIPEGRFKSMIVQVRYYTDRNEHTKALYYLARRLDDDKVAVVLDAIHDISEFMGSIPNDLISLRDNLRKRLLSGAKHHIPSWGQMSPEEYEALRMSF